MSRILDIPRRIGRTVWAFVNPSRTAGRIAWGRTVILIQIVVAAIFVGYTLAKKSIRLPTSGEPYTVQVLFDDAQGLDRLDEPAAAVAGTPLGSVTDVQYENGKALATLTFRDEVRGKIYSDATVSVRPASALQNLLVNVDPGTPPSQGGEVLAEDAVIEPGRTRGYVTIDELTSILDADTRAYVSILVEQARIGLRDRESDLAAGLQELGEVSDTATPLADALAKRRRLLARLVTELDQVARTVGSRGEQLAQAIGAGNATLEVTASREEELAQLTRELGPMLAETGAAVTRARGISRILVPALDELIPAAKPLAEGLAGMNDLLPKAEDLTDRFRQLVRDGRDPTDLLIEGTRGIRGRVEAIVPDMQALTALSRRLNRHRYGMTQMADTLSAATSMQDENGAYLPINITIEPLKPENFGLPANASTASQKLALRQFAAALEAVCLDDTPEACLMRFSMPGLPEQPILRDAEVPGEGGKR